MMEEPQPIALGDKLRVTIRIKDATGLPRRLANFVNCEYTFANCDPVAIPELLDPPQELLPPTPKSGATVVFDPSQAKSYELDVTESLLHHLRTGTLAIKVAGHNTQLAGGEQRQADGSVTELKLYDASTSSAAGAEASNEDPAVK